MSEMPLYLPDSGGVLRKPHFFIEVGRTTFSLKPLFYRQNALQRTSAPAPWCPRDARRGGEGGGPTYKRGGVEMTTFESGNDRFERQNVVFWIRKGCQNWPISWPQKWSRSPHPDIRRGAPRRRDRSGRSFRVGNSITSLWEKWVELEKWSF